MGLLSRCVTHRIEFSKSLGLSRAITRGFRDGLISAVVWSSWKNDFYISKDWTGISVFSSFAEVVITLSHKVKDGQEEEQHFCRDISIFDNLLKMLIFKSSKDPSRYTDSLRKQTDWSPSIKESFNQKIPRWIWREVTSTDKNNKNRWSIPLSFQLGRSIWRGVGVSTPKVCPKYRKFGGK